MAAVVVFHFAGRAVLQQVLAQLHAANAQGGKDRLPHDFVVGLP